MIGRAAPLSPNGEDERRSSCSGAILWAWEELNLRLHPQVKIAGRGGKLPGTYQGRRGPRPLRGAVNGPGAVSCCHLHPSGWPKAMSQLSASGREPPCGGPFLQVTSDRRGPKLSVLTACSYAVSQCSGFRTAPGRWERHGRAFGLVGYQPLQLYQACYSLSDVGRAVAPRGRGGADAAPARRPACPRPRRRQARRSRAGAALPAPKRRQGRAGPPGAAS
jgi:hypothetical protein